MQKKDINVLHAELVNPSEVITCSTGMAMDLHLTDTFKPYEDYALGQEKRKVLAKRLWSTTKFWERGGSLILAHNSLPLLEERSIGC